MAVIVWVHNLIYRLAFGLVRLTLGLIWRWLLVVVALLGEEVRRYAGLALSGTIIVLLGKATLNYAPPPAKKWLVLFVLVMLAVWAMAVRRGIRYTRYNSLRQVKTRQSVRDLHEKVGDIQGRVTDGLAQRTRNMPAGRVFKSNRDKIAAAEEQTRRAEAEAAERAAHEAYLDSLPPDHDPFVRSR